MTVFHVIQYRSSAPDRDKCMVWFVRASGIGRPSRTKSHPARSLPAASQAGRRVGASHLAFGLHCKKSHGQIPLHSQDVHGPKSSWNGKCLLLLAWVKPCSILQFFNSSGKFQFENPSTDRNFPLMTLPEAGVFHCEWGFLIIFFPPTGSFRLFTLPQTVFFQ